jgi:hypothetical protein
MPGDNRNITNFFGKSSATKKHQTRHGISTAIADNIVQVFQSYTPVNPIRT